MFVSGASAMPKCPLQRLRARQLRQVAVDVGHDRLRRVGGERAFEVPSRQAVSSPEEEGACEIETHAHEVRMLGQDRAKDGYGGVQKRLARCSLRRMRGLGRDKHGRPGIEEQVHCPCVPRQVRTDDWRPRPRLRPGAGGQPRRSGRSSTEPGTGAIAARPRLRGRKMFRASERRAWKGRAGAPRGAGLGRKPGCASGILPWGLQACSCRCTTNLESLP